MLHCPEEPIVVGTYDSHRAAEEAVCDLGSAGLPLDKMTIICRTHGTCENIQGYCRPAGAALEGAIQGSLFGGVLTLVTGIAVLLHPHGAHLYLCLVGASVVVGGCLGAAVRGVLTACAPGHVKLKYQQRIEPESFVVVFNDNLATYTGPAEATWPPAIDRLPVVPAGRSTAATSFSGWHSLS